MIDFNNIHADNYRLDIVDTLVSKLNDWNVIKLGYWYFRIHGVKLAENSLVAYDIIIINDVLNIVRGGVHATITKMGDEVIQRVKCDTHITVNASNLKEGMIVKEAHKNIYREVFGIRLYGGRMFLDLIESSKELRRIIIDEPDYKLFTILIKNYNGNGTLRSTS